MSSVLFDVPGPRAARRHRIIGIATVIAVIAIIGAVIWKFQAEGQLTYAKWEPFFTPSLIQLLLKGLAWTILAGALAIVFAVPLGMVLGVAKLSDHRIIRWPAWLFVEFFRAVPLLMLIIFIWSMQGFPLDTIFPLVLGLLLYNGSVLAEVVRAGINAVPVGQAEAAYALGLRKHQVMRIILLPQAIKIMLPSFISQCIVALKDTSLGFYILAPGLTFAGREIYKTFQNYLQTAIVLAVVYIILNLLLGLLGEWLQRRFGGESKIQMVGDVVRAQPEGATARA
ncbi:amino acid ABC transporter permease [Aeromicrobium wangtongii]|uniref:Amino acid ABC transporter permease n=1 Tax=Aeromicrobium wangtongii TaxID=2969247 RepID=A0ABY5M2K2_9ACTN|nr:amino acid ABC transporter permease [Aeromicrobium wangtongii]MCD9198394.1 amino acid ABC transporter permease [Aeromicrobium wangtongii]UUP12424.1 amino acid ABC transporter permease [Aeromicrobium wangtongii]